VEDDPGGIDHPPETSDREEPRGSGGHGILRDLGLPAGQDLPPQTVQRLTDGGCGFRASVVSGERRAGGVTQNYIYCREAPETLFLARLQHTSPSITREAWVEGRHDPLC
jgi:hypothetical protein